MRTDDARRWVSERAVGVVRTMMEVEPLLEDVEGAVAADDPDYAAFVGRHLVLRCTSLVSLCRGGSLDLDNSLIAFDWFEEVPEEVVGRARELALGPLGPGRADLARWLEEVRAFVAEAVEALGLGPLPRIRAGETMFAALALARDWVDLCAALGGPVVVVAP